MVPEYCRNHTPAPEKIYADGSNDPGDVVNDQVATRVLSRRI
jgi:hypothetical protein